MPHDRNLAAFHVEALLQMLASVLRMKGNFGSGIRNAAVEHIAIFNSSKAFLSCSSKTSYISFHNSVIGALPIARSETYDILMCTLDVTI